MVICVCKGVSDRKIRKMIHTGDAKSLREIQALCQAGSDCGTCVCSLKELVQQALDESHPKVAEG